MSSKDIFITVRFWRKAAGTRDKYVRSQASDRDRYIVIPAYFSGEGD